MKNRSAGYELLRTYVRIAFWLTHRKVVVTGLSNIPENKPIIFAPNHQNALMDPLALVCTNPLQTSWLARADIFKLKTARSALKFMKMLPVYRIRDGKDNLSNNEQIFNQVIRILEKNDSVALFPEAAHSLKRQMLPHKKAIPRIALEAEEKNNFQLNLQIVPVGIHYDHYWNFNRTIIVNYGVPIEVDKYRVEYLDNPQKAMLSLRDEIFDTLSRQIIQINSKTDYQDFENIRQLAHTDSPGNHFFRPKKILNRFYAEQKLIVKLEQLELDRPETAKQIMNDSRNYFLGLHQARLSDEKLLMAKHSSFLKVFSMLIPALFSLPVFAFGFILNALPFYVPRFFLRKKIKDRAFISTFNFVAGLIIFPVAYLFESFLIYLFSHSILLSVLVFLLMPIAGKISYELCGFYQKIGSQLSVLFGNQEFRRKQNELWKKRQALIKSISV